MAFSSPSLDKRNIGSIPNGRLTPTLLIITSLLLFVSMRSSPHIQLKSRCLMQDRSDRSSTHCHTRKPVPVRLSRSNSLNLLMDGDSAPYAIEIRWRGQIPQGRLTLSQETRVLKHRLSRLVGRHRRGDWYIHRFISRLMTDRGFSRTRHSEHDG